MAYDEAIRNITLKADASLAGYTGVSGTPGATSPHYGKAQFRWVVVSGPKTCARAAAPGKKIVGVCQNKPQVVGQAATISIRGISVVLAGGAFVAGDLVTVDGQGRTIKSAAAGDEVGIAIEDSAGIDTATSVLIRCN